MAQTKAQLISGTATQELALSKATLGAGTVGAPALTTSGDTNTGIFFPAADTIAFAEGGTESARFDSSGRLLVGTSSSRTSAAIQIEGTTFGTSTETITRNSSDAAPPYLQLIKSRGTSVGAQTLVSNGDGLGSIQFVGADGTQTIAAASVEAFVDGIPGSNDMPSRLVFSTTADGASSPTERMRISQNGTTRFFGANPIVVGTNAAADASSANAILSGRYSATSTTGGGTDCVFITSNGNLYNTNGTYGTISDAKLKENIVNASSQWSDVKALQVRNFNFKEGQTHRQIGFIAQEVEQVSPGLVTESPDRDEDGNETGEVTKQVNLSVLYIKAVKALQEAMERIETLEASNADLLARVTALEAS